MDYPNCKKKISVARKFLEISKAAQMRIKIAQLPYSNNSIFIK